MLKKFDVGLFVGRFQPFHIGHMHALKLAMASCKKLVIVVGSSQKSGTKTNPLSVDSRIRIIRAALKGAGINDRNLSFIAVPDFENDDAWFSYIRGMAPRIDAVFSRNPVVKRIFRARGIAVLAPRWHMRRKFSATNVRQRIRSGKKWRNMVPEGAIKEMESHEEEIRKAKID